MKTHDIVATFTQKDNFLLLIHHNPDGDAIASSLALGLALRALGKNVDIVCADLIPVQFQFLPGVSTIKHDFLLGDYDVIVTLDCGDSKRTGFQTRIKQLVRKQRKILINIDHHSKNDLHGLATHNYVDYSAPSTTYLVGQLLQDLHVSLNHKLATCLLTGLYTDTGGFKHPNTTPEALKFAAMLLSAGARLKTITRHISQPSSVSRLKLWGIALSRIERHGSLDLISTYITHKDLESAGAKQEDIAGIATLLTTIPARCAALVVTLADKTIQVRLRTKSKGIDLSELATYVGGGGQKKTAGFTLKQIEETVSVEE